MFYYQQPKLPSKEPTDILVDILDFFTNKITKLRQLLQKSIENQTTCSRVNTQQTAIHPDAKSSKTCPLDPLPSNRVQDCLTSLSSTITMIVKESLVKGEFPSTFKNCHMFDLILKNQILTDRYALPIDRIAHMGERRAVNREVGSSILSRATTQAFKIVE